MSSKSDKKAIGEDTVLKLARPVLEAVTTVLPLLIDWVQKANDLWNKVPNDYLLLIVGTIFCFFGGVYPTLFAAIQAVKAGGFKDLKDALEDLAEEATKIMEASDKDDEVDKDNDGIADVEQIDDKDLILRKMNLVITKMNPSKVDTALSVIYRIWFAVIATLKVEFAMVITMALTLAEFMKKAINRVLRPIADHLIPEKYAKWVPVIIGWATKAFAMSIAWTVQSIVSALSSACEGGLIISRTGLKILVDKGITLGGIIPEDDTETEIDEYASYILAMFGFLFQVKMGFSVPFPFNVFLLPLEISEWYIRWTITS